MSKEPDPTASELHRRAEAGSHSSNRQEGAGSFDPGAPFGASRNGGSGHDPFFPGRALPREQGAVPINLGRLLEMLIARWKWLLAGAALAGGAAFLVGLGLTSSTAQVTLIHRENPNAFTAGGGDNSAPQAYISRELSAQTLFVLMRSPEVFRRVSEKAIPPIRPEQLARAARVTPERDPDFVTLSISDKSPKESLVKWVNLYADEVVNYTKDLQAEEAGSVSDFLKTKLKGIEGELRHVNEDLVLFSEQAQTLDVDKEVEAYMQQIAAVDAKTDTARLDLETIDLRIQNFENALAQQKPDGDRLQAATERLDRLRGEGFTDLWPEVVAQKRIIENLKKQGNTGVTNSPDNRPATGTFASAVQLQILELKSQKEVRLRELEKYELLKAKMLEKTKGLSKTAVVYAQFKARQRRLEDLHTAVVSKQQEAQLLQENALGSFKVYSYASAASVSAFRRFFTVGCLSIVGALLGLLAAAAAALLAAALDNRVRTASDLQRVSGLPVLATLGDLRLLNPKQQIDWAFRTLTMLQGKLNSSSDRTLVCGFISSRHGEGRSTWIRLLVSAASQRGMRVLTVATRPGKAGDASTPEMTPKELSLLPVGPATTLTRNVLAYPAQVTEQFSDPQTQPIVHIPLPGWVWSLERRQQWHVALEHWQGIENLVLLIELPPACQPESILLAEHLPQLIWLAGSDMAEIEETRQHLETLRHARCNLVGAVLNREPASFFRKRFGRWMRRLTALACLGASLSPARAGASHETADTPVRATNFSFSVTSRSKRAPWQQRLTLGPGDAFDLSIFGHPELTRTNMIVGPDGRISYLQIEGLSAAGLTIDELRAKLDAELEKYFIGGVRTIVTPASFNSKKYCILGTVVSAGVFTLDRPLTIIEAVARAKGLQTSSSERSVAEVADLPRSFLVRHGKRLPVDLEKLFHEGDLSQNIAIEPSDYLYFAPAKAEEIYVLGEVFSPGLVGMSDDASVVAAITARGGFTERAYRKRVLVIRGSLQHPEAFAVDTSAIVTGRIPDFKLEPSDIVYVHPRPWIRAEELLDIAIQAFIEAAVTEWAGVHVPTP
jgi:protein involved in polysaccharide export with SLBB domain/capsular polysaccharide biosynthesis protein